MEEKTINLHDYFRVVRKAKVSIVSIFLLLFTVFALIALLLPAIYRSSATILIEQQEIPRELVMSTVTSYASERIQTIQAKVMSRTNLFEIIDKFNLYEKERKKETSEEIVAQMREDVALDLISADVVDPRTGRPSSATIAFSLSYNGESPQMVQRVANELVTLYLNMNLENRAAKAEETSIFFKEEVARSGEKISVLEKELAIFKESNASMLPQMQVVNVRALQRLESEISNINARLRALDESRFNLEAKLDQIDPDNPLVQSVSSRLKIREAEYITAVSKYSDSHPNVINLKNEIASLKADQLRTGDPGAIAEELKLLRSELAALDKKYTSAHPDVVAIKSKISALENKLNNEIVNAETDYYKKQPENPAYITLKARLDSAISEIASLKDQENDLVDKKNELDDGMLKAPQIEREYLKMQRDYENALSHYRGIQSKQMSADIAKQLEVESKGERFTLIDPAVLPELPISPNRVAILTFGFILALGAGVGFAFVVNAIGRPVGGVRSIISLIDVAPLAVIPYQMNTSDLIKRKKYRKRFLFIALAVALLAVFFIHFFVSPLDVIWFRLLRKAEIVAS